MYLTSISTVARGWSLEEGLSHERQQNNYNKIKPMEKKYNKSIVSSMILLIIAGCSHFGCVKSGDGPIKTARIFKLPSTEISANTSCMCPQTMTAKRHCRWFFNCTEVPAMVNGSIISPAGTTWPRSTLFWWSIPPRGNMM